MNTALCKTFYVESNLLFATFNNQEFGKFKIRPPHSILKEMDDG